MTQAQTNADVFAEVDERTRKTRWIALTAEGANVIEEVFGADLISDEVADFYTSTNMRTIMRTKARLTACGLTVKVLF